MTRTRQARVIPNEKEISHSGVWVANALRLHRDGTVGFIDGLNEALEAHKAMGEERLLGAV